MLYLLTFYFGFPLTCALVFQFDVAVVKADYLLYAQLAATSFYAIYYVAYKTRLSRQPYTPRRALFSMNKVETNLTCLLLILVAVVTVGIFFMQNGFLLFKLKSYSQIFSQPGFWRGIKTLFLFLHTGNVDCLFLATNTETLDFLPC
ncbi:putative common antigen polymerase [Providencia rettgeri]|uniref:Putative common antigen polymerase n=1 Tax=Providencia rettgeri TaxID=587 RepID=A0A379FXA0_PRORE|nr:putative common antigen polymerase [Providencia rettgeri]